MEDCWRRSILDCCSRASFSSAFILNELTWMSCSISTRLCSLSYNDTIFIIICSFQSTFPSIFLCGPWFLFPLCKWDHDLEWFGNFSSKASKPWSSWLESQLKEALPHPFPSNFSLPPHTFFPQNSLIPSGSPDTKGFTLFLTSTHVLAHFSIPKLEKLTSLCDVSEDVCSRNSRDLLHGFPGAWDHHASKLNLLKLMLLFSCPFFLKVVCDSQSWCFPENLMAFLFGPWIEQWFKP